MGWIFTTNTGEEFESEFKDYKAACEEYVEYLASLGYLYVEEIIEKGKY